MARKGKSGSTRDPQPQARTCDTMEMHYRLAQTDAEYRARRRQSEYEVKQWLQRYRGAALRLPIVRIPVVVHVVYFDPAVDNISDAQIRSQIDVLNADYRMLNADSGTVPDSFKPLRADTRIEFGLAVRGPNCTATNGITRRQTTINGFSKTNEVQLKSTALGGTDPWPRDSYLNIWVCNYNILGYGRYPVAPAELDGVVVNYKAFGTIEKAASPPNNLGRTATHEVGHWLYLFHLWGDNNDPNPECQRSDEVADTPTQQGPTAGCPTSPQITCGNGPNGNMFMNYMDWSYDRCLRMFTAGQAQRMHATLQTSRAPILGSDGLIPPPAGNAPDLWSRNTVLDVGVEPDPTPELMFVSDDIWVRHARDGFSNHDHQNPQYHASGLPNYVYVRVRNRGCPSMGAQNGTLRLYWAKASLSLSWPAPWDGSVIHPVPMGGPIGAQPTSVNGGSETIYEFPWSPPNPRAYAFLGAAKDYFGLLARIETASTAPYGMTYPETSNLHANVKNNNNIVCKCVTVLDGGIGAVKLAFMMANFSRQQSFASIVLRAPETDQPSIFEFGQFSLGKRRLAVTKSGAALERVPLAPSGIEVVEMQFVPDKGFNQGARVWALDAIQLDEKKEIVGGQRFYLKTGVRPDKFKDPYSGRFDGVSWHLRLND